MAFTFEPGWDDPDNHLKLAGVTTEAEVQAVVSSFCAGKTSTDNVTHALLTLCAAADARARVLKGVHQAEAVGVIDATYHVTINIPWGSGGNTFHVYFSLTVIDLSAPKGTSKKAWRKLPLDQRQYRKFALAAVSYRWNGVYQWPEIT